jgi:hypothetical protein
MVGRIDLVLTKKSGHKTLSHNVLLGNSAKIQ